jgi:hypothetical protein
LIMNTFITFSFWFLMKINNIQALVFLYCDIFNAIVIYQHALYTYCKGNS